MKRRSFIGGLAGPFAHAMAAAREEKIAAVEIWRLEGHRTGPVGGRRQHQVQPLHIYDEHRPKAYRETGEAKTATVAASALYLKIRCESGLEGIYGPIDAEAAVVVDRQLKRFLTGKNALAGDVLWDQMHRSNRHARASHFMMAISAVDNALWDLRGRYFRAPVYQLMGGPARGKVEAYGSCLGFSVEPERAAAKAVELKQEGFRHQKWFLAYGPGDGPQGLKMNVELVRALREAAGDEVELMFDAFNGWHLDYAIAWAKQVEKFRPRWIEEAFPSEKMESFVELRKATSVPVATGEHFYGRWEAQRFLRAGAISVVQADPEWCGGAGELARICTIASVYDAQVVPHGHSLLAALHVVAAQPPVTCPLVEFLINKMRTWYFFEKHEVKPVRGYIELPDRPGFGIEIDDSKVEKRALQKWS